jgi:hydrogenase/urease accessory protein HupE
MAGDRVSSRPRSAGAAGLAFLALALLPTPAHAHLVTSGLGPFYDGVSHVALTPEDLLPALALALLAGLRGASASRLALFTLPAAWLLAGLAGLAAGAEATPGRALATLALLVLGVLVAADARVRPAGITGLALALGLTSGYLNGTAMAQARLGALGLAGIVSTLFVLLALATAFVVSLERDWARVAVRVAGSWMVAIGLLMLGWTLREMRV